jgi:hypothetical protein
MTPLETTSLNKKKCHLESLEGRETIDQSEKSPILYYYNTQRWA